MQPAVEQHEIGKAVFLEQPLQVELDIGLTADEGGIAQQAQGAPVGHQSPQGFGAVQILLDERVRRKARLAGGGEASQLLMPADDVQENEALSTSRARGW